MSNLIGSVYEPTDSLSDNVISLNPSKYRYAGMKMIDRSEIKYGFNPKTRMISETEERLGIKSIEESYGWEFSALRKMTSDLSIENRWVNPNPINFIRGNDRGADFGSVNAWFLDVMMVLSQTVPDLAKKYFIRLDELFGEGQEEEVRKWRRELRKRLKKVNRNKLRNLRSTSSDDLTESEMMKIHTIQSKMVEREYWGRIGKSLGTQYVSNYVMDPDRVEHLMCTHTISEVSIPLFASAILGENWRDGEDCGKDLFGQVGDSATVFGVILLNSLRKDITKEDIEEMVNTKSMRSYFDSRVREFLTEHLNLCVIEEGGIPVFSVDDTDSI